MSFDQVSDMLTRIRNAQMAGNADASMPASKFKLALARALYSNEYIEEVSIFSEGDKNCLRLKLKYFGTTPAIKGISRVSKQGQRIYAGSKDLPRVKNNFGVAFISTSKGIMTDKQARKDNLGGEVICKVW